MISEKQAYTPKELKSTLGPVKEICYSEKQKYVSVKGRVYQNEKSRAAF